MKFVAAAAAALVLVCPSAEAAKLLWLPSKSENLLKSHSKSIVAASRRTLLRQRAKFDIEGEIEK